jgi:hypothetical protein
MTSTEPGVASVATQRVRRVLADLFDEMPEVWTNSTVTVTRVLFSMNIVDSRLRNGVTREDVPQALSKVFLSARVTWDQELISITWTPEADEDRPLPREYDTPEDYPGPDFDI